MSSFDAGTAFVRVVPDSTNFARQLQAQVDAAVAQVKVPASVSQKATGATQAAATQATVKAVAATDALAAATSNATATALRYSGVTEIAEGATLKEAAAVLQLNRALFAEAQAQAKAAGATIANAEATKAAIAAQATQVTRLRTASGEVAAIGTSAEKASKGLLSASTRTNILQGSILGLSRITPVAVFGLGVYGSAAIAAGLALKSSVSAAADFEQQLNILQATTGISTEELAKVRKEALALGADASLAAVSASDAASAMTELAKAGLSVTDSLAAARGVLELAGAAGLSAGESARIVATQLNAFGLAGNQAVRVADLISAASIAAQGDIADFAAGFQQLSAVANQTGLSLEQTTALLTELAKAGLQGADAGTSLRTFLLRLTPTTKEAQQYAKALGVTLDENKTIGQQLPQVIDQYRNALQQLNPVQRTTVLNQIFGQDAIRGASIVFSQSSQSFQQLNDSLTRGGDAQRLAEARAKGLSGAFNGLANELETVGIEFGSLVDGPLEKFVRGITETVTEVDNLVKAIGDLSSTASNVVIPVIRIPVEIVGSIPGSGTAGRAFNAFFDKGKYVASGPLSPALALKDFLAQFKNDTSVTGGVTLNPGELVGNNDFGFKAFYNSVVQATNIANDKGFQAAAAAARANDSQVQKNVAALIAKGLPGGSSGKSPGEIVVEAAQSSRFQVPILEAQLSGDLQAELAADKSVVAFLKARLALAKEGTKAYRLILEALVSANQATQAVQAQIKQQQDQRTKDAADAAKAAKQQADNVVRAYQELQDKNLSNAIERATLSGSAQAQRNAINRNIDVLKQRIADIKKIKNLTVDQKQAIADLEGSILGLRGQLKSLNQKSGADGGGFSLNDLFKTAVDQFNTFGSNIAGRNGILSPQDARAALGLQVAQDISSNVQQAQLSEAQKQTALLASIDSKISAPGTSSTQAARLVSQAGNFGGWRAANEAARNQYGAN